MMIKTVRTMTPPTEPQPHNERRADVEAVFKWLYGLDLTPDETARLHAAVDEGIAPATARTVRDLTHVYEHCFINHRDGLSINLPLVLASSMNRERTEYRATPSRSGADAKATT